MLALIFDTETTGMVDFKADYKDPHQPDIIQIGMYLADLESVYSQVELLVQPVRHEVSEEAAAVHGISTEVASDYGITINSALRLFAFYANKANLLVAHNYQFDIRVIKTALHRVAFEDDILCELRDNISLSKFFCTMKEATDVCCIPHPSRRGCYKWPKLQEAYQKLVDPAGFSGAHSALADVEACYKLWRVLLS